MEEVWKNIPGYEGKYQVSNLGIVRSLDRIDDENHFRKGQIMKQKYLREYARVVLRNGKRQKEYQVHRLVAFAFPEICGEWFPGAQVNHKNENTRDNRAENLEWCTVQYNINYGDRNKKVSKALSGRKHEWNRKSVLCYDLDGNFVSKYDSVYAAAEVVDRAPTNITACLKGKQKTSGGFVWKYA